MGHRPGPQLNFTSDTKPRPSVACRVPQVPPAAAHLPAPQPCSARCLHTRRPVKSRMHLFLLEWHSRGLKPTVFMCTVQWCSVHHAAVTHTSFARGRPLPPSVPESFSLNFKAQVSVSSARMPFSASSPPLVQGLALSPSAPQSQLYQTTLNSLSTHGGQACWSHSLNAQMLIEWQHEGVKE